MGTLKKIISKIRHNYLRGLGLYLLKLSRSVKSSIQFIKITSLFFSADRPDLFRFCLHSNSLIYDYSFPCTSKVDNSIDKKPK